MLACVEQSTVDLSCVSSPGELIPFIIWKPSSAVLTATLFSLAKANTLTSLSVAVGLVDAATLVLQHAECILNCAERHDVPHTFSIQL